MTLAGRLCFRNAAKANALTSLPMTATRSDIGGLWDWMDGVQSTCIRGYMQGIAWTNCTLIDATPVIEIPRINGDNGERGGGVMVSHADEPTESQRAAHASATVRLSGLDTLWTSLSVADNRVIRWRSGDGVWLTEGESFDSLGSALNAATLRWIASSSTRASNDDPITCDNSWVS